MEKDGNARINDYKIREGKAREGTGRENLYACGRYRSIMFRIVSQLY